MNREEHFLQAECDFFVGRRGQLKRYLMCSLQGYFPVLVKNDEDLLAAVVRTNGPHVSIAGTLSVMVSRDKGKSWSDPERIAPGWEDNRNPALGVNQDGELVAAYWKSSNQRYRSTNNGPVWHTGELTEEAKNTPSVYVIKSKDFGLTWDEPRAYLPELLNYASPYGRMITAPDGTLLMSIYGQPRQAAEGVKHYNMLIRSRDGGETWGDESLVLENYNETSYCFLPDGELLAAARCTDKQHIVLTRSKDMGYTWSDPVQVTRRKEIPADLTLLQSGKLLLTFGRRIRPFGCGALISEDGGQTWNHNREVLLAGDSVANWDCGYPSTVQLSDGTIVTALYFAGGSAPSEKDVLSSGWGTVSCQAIHYREEDIT